MTDLTLTVRKLIPVPAERVYNAWLDPAMMRKFLFGGPDMHVSAVETDPKVGGRYRVVMTNASGDVPHSGTYLTLTPHSHITFTWELPYSVEGSTVSLDFTPEGQGTMVTLTQVRFANEGARDGHTMGWTFILDTLATGF